MRLARFTGSKGTARHGDWETAFKRALSLFGQDLPPCAYQARLSPGRQLRWDAAWPHHRVAVEIQGGIFVPKTGHSSGVGIQADMRKLNLASQNGYWPLAFGPNDLTTWQQGEVTIEICRRTLVMAAERLGLDPASNFDALLPGETRPLPLVGG